MKHKTVKKHGVVKRILLLLTLIITLLFSVQFVKCIGQATDTQSFFDIVKFSGQFANTDHGWNLILVNNEYRIPNDWEINLIELSNGQSVDERIYPALQQMFDDMRAQGVYPVVVSGYRTTEKQQELMDAKIADFMEQGYSRSQAKAEAKKWVANVGYSEHQIGLAVDINADGVHSTGQQVYKWLAENAWQYGFILRYAENKTEITGTYYEPWHYRYVGIDAATEIYQSGLCLEEYIETLN